MQKLKLILSLLIIAYAVIYGFSKYAFKSDKAEKTAKVIVDEEIGTVLATTSDKEIFNDERKCEDTKLTCAAFGTTTADMWRLIGCIQYSSDVAHCDFKKIESEDSEEGVFIETVNANDIVNCREGEFTFCESRPKSSEKEYCEMLSDTGIGALPAKCFKYYK